MGRVKKRRKQSGLVYFAINDKINNVVKIGKTVESIKNVLKNANTSNAFMPGKWKITTKVSTKKVDRTYDLAKKLFIKDKGNVSASIFVIPTDMTVPQMGAILREKDKEFAKLKEKEEDLIKL